MSFKTDLPDWKSYSETTFFMKTVPQTAYDELKGLVKRASKNAAQLKRILDAMAEMIPCEAVQDWSWDFLVYDIPAFVDAIETKVDQGRFPVFMDCISTLVEKGSLSIEEINDFLEDNAIGYRSAVGSNNQIKWFVIEGSAVLKKIEETQPLLSSISQQAFDEIRRAKKSLEDSDDDRAIKDALRSCVSAMEAVVKAFGNDIEIGNATKNLKAQGGWGCDEIVKEGNSIFNTMHRLYPDLRHGSTQVSSLSMNEAEYWIGRILNYLQYMAKQEKQIEKAKNG